MMKLHTLMARIRGDEKGATAIEYGLLAALVAVVIIVAVSTIGQQLNEGFTLIANQLEQVEGIEASLD